MTTELLCEDKAVLIILKEMRIITIEQQDE